MNNTQRSAALLATLILTAKTASASPILTEIHYNGIASGADPDEFIELTNVGERVLDLQGWRFTQGIDYLFGAGATLAAGASLVLARDVSDFLDLYANYGGDLFDFSGALSNSGETIALADAAGNEVWSLSYDDRDPWPGAADGLGSSLQLKGNVSDISLPENWEAKVPSPGVWDRSAEPPNTVSAPATGFHLMTGGALISLLRRRKSPPNRLQQDRNLRGANFLKLQKM